MTSWWSRLFGGGPRAARPPSWAAFERLSDFEVFVEVVREVLDEHRVGAERSMIRSGSVIVPRGDGTMREWHLSTLAERCAETERSTWGSSVRSSFRKHVKPAAAGKAEGERREGKPPTQKPARAHALADLRLQLFSEEYLAATNLDRASLVSNRLLDGLHAVLVRDIRDGAEMTVQRGEAKGWRWSDADLLALGRKQAIASDVTGVVVRPLVTEAGTLEVAVNNGFYLGACVLGLLEELDVEQGVLVAFVTWHHVVMHKIAAATTHRTVAEMARLVATLDSEARVASAERLGITLHWFRRGAGFEAVRLERGEGVPRVVAPADLAVLLDAAS